VTPDDFRRHPHRRCAWWCRIYLEALKETEDLDEALAAAELAFSM
jgi:hypothetical protein